MQPNDTEIMGKREHSIFSLLQKFLEEQNIDKADTFNYS